MTKRARLLLAVTILSSPLLTACGKYVRSTTPPPELLACKELPPAPSLPGKDQQDVRDMLTLEYILGIRDAYADCAGKLAGVRVWAEGVE